MKPLVSDDQIRAVMATAHSIKQAALELGMTERQLGTRVRALDLPRRKPGGFKRPPLAPCEAPVQACSLPVDGLKSACGTLRARTTKHRSSPSAAKQDRRASSGADV